jgi:dienelactone hydrolase
MKNRHLFCLSLFLLSFLLSWGALTCAAKEPPASRVVDLTAADGTALKATFFSAGKPGPGVLLLHQCNRQRKVWDGLAQQLASVGINVLTLDFPGFGESGGTPFTQLTPEQAGLAMVQKFPPVVDIALQYLKSQPGVKEEMIGAGGASCGVNQSVQAALRHPEVKSLVLLSGNTDLNGRQFLRKSSVPVFFAVADDDEFRPTVEVMEWLYSLTANPGKKLAHYETGGHGADMFPVHPELPTTIVNWYVTTLIKTPGRAPASKEPAPVSQKAQVLNLIDQPGGAAKVTQLLQEARQKDPKAALFSEAIVNALGYEHLLAGDNKVAVEIMKLNAFAYPDSPNVYDSLADAYLADGQRDLARQNAQKVLELLPSDSTDPPDRRDGLKAAAEQKLKQL